MTCIFYATPNAPKSCTMQVYRLNAQINMSASVERKVEAHI